MTEDLAPGGAGGFRALFDDFYTPVFRFFAKRGLADAECHDLAQETFLRVYRGLAGFRGEASRSTWIFAIAANTLRQRARHRSRRKRAAVEVSLETLLHDRPASGPPSAPDPDDGPLDRLLQREQIEAVRATVRSLPPQMRRCLLLRVEQGRSYQEIAAMLKLTTDTVKTHLFQARKRLKERMRQEMDVETQRRAGSA